MSLFSDLFGGTDRSAQKGQIRANAGSQDFIEQQSQIARNDLLNLFGDADQASRAGSQAALDVFGQTIPQQFSAISQGNMGAQQTIADGIRGSRAALMGLPFQNSLAPQGINIDSSFAQQQLPESTFGNRQGNIAQGLQGLSPEENQLIQDFRISRQGAF
ncbi:MAG: hypothetical protein COA78_25310 [Blastopirellula sp.]|nr:MAG: hypothetical protein COA78_25310 [Blastopirellula sp.]